MRTVLIVDDEAGLRRILEMRIRKHGYEVLTAENGVEAMKLVKSDSVDLILSDVRMPGGDGVSLLEDLARMEGAPPIILMTGFSDITSDEAITAGAVAIFDKPLQSKDVLKAIDDTMKKHYSSKSG